MHKNKDASLAEELPYWDFIDGPGAHAILYDGSLVAGIRVQLIDSECFDEAKTNSLTLGIRSILNSISEGTTIQFVLNVGSDYSRMLKKHSESKSEVIHPLIKNIAFYREKSLQRAMDQRELYRPDLIVYVRVPAVEPKKLNPLKKKEVFTEESVRSYEETFEALGQNIETLVSGFESLGLACSELAKGDILKNIYEFLNPKRSRGEPVPEVKSFDESDLEKEVLEDMDWLASQSPREQLVFGDLVLGFEQFSLDGFYHRIMTLKTLPEVTYAGMLAHFLRLPFHYALVLSVEVPIQAAEMAKLQQKRKMAHSMAATSGGRASDLESESRLSSTEELIRELLNTGQRIFAAQMSIILKAPATLEGAKQLNREVREVLARFRGLQGAEGLEESVGAWKVFKGNLPAAPLALERARKMKTNNLADFLPIYGPREGDRDPVVIFRNRLNGLVSYDPFDSGLTNFSSLVTGSSGAGKSFLYNCILFNELARKTRVFVVDIGGSYRKLTEALNGQYLAIDLEDQYRINPFHLVDPTQEPSSHKVKSLLAVVESMVADGEKARLPKLDRVLLEKAILELYEDKRRAGAVPILSDLMQKLAKSEEPSLQTISKLLFSWTGDRPYGRLLDGQGCLEANSSICTFDLKGLSSYPDLQGVMILILTDFILSQVDGDKERKKRIIMDEAWELLKSPASANFMESCARTLRKNGSGITFITQGVEEIAASPIGAAILNNTATKFVMLQCGDMEVLRESLKLNNQEIALIQSLSQKKGRYSEGFMIEGAHRQVVRIYPSPFEYWLSTSDPQDNLYLSGLRDQGLDLIEAIEKAVVEYPNGIAAGHGQGGVA